MVERILPKGSVLFFFWENMEYFEFSFWENFWMHIKI